jgi:hypothetical protein
MLLIILDLHHSHRQQNVVQKFNSMIPFLQNIIYNLIRLPLHLPSP